MMKIAFLNSIETDIYGGMEEWIRMVAEGLAEKNNEVTLLGRLDSNFLKRAGASDKVKTVGLNISGDFNPFTIARIKEFINNESLDYLVVNFNKDIRLGGLSAKMSGKTKVIWSVGLDITKNNLVHKTLTPKLIDRVIVPSNSLKIQITAPGYIDPEIVDVIPIGIEDKVYDKTDRLSLIYKYNLPQDAIISVTVGRLVDQKAHKYLVEAASAIISKCPNIRFLFLGDGPNKGDLKNQISQKRLEKYFIFCGMLDNIDFELANSDLMIHPSREEPFGIAVLEGMRASLPIAASRVGGIPEVVEENYNALMFEPENVSDLEKVVLDMLSDPDRMSELGANGRKRYEQYFKYDDMITNVENSLGKA